MGDACAKADGLGIFVSIVDGVLVARQPSDAHNVSIGQRLCRNIHRNIQRKSRPGASYGDMER